MSPGTPVIVDTELQKLRIDKSHKARRDERSAWPWIVLIVVLATGAVLAWQWRSASAATVVQTIRVRVPDASTTDSSADSDTVLLNATGYIMAAHKIEL